MVQRGKLFVLSAPSGAGKTTLKDLLLKEEPGITYSISATTRPKRTNEVDGKHYYFYDRREFEQKVKAGEFVEYNEVHGNLYGTPKGPIEVELQKGRSVIFDLDVFGKINFDKTYPEAIGILIEPPDIAELTRRLEGRKTDSRATIELRLRNAVKELEFARTQGKYDYVIVNDSVDRALAELKKVVRTEMGKK